MKYNKYTIVGILFGLVVFVWFIIFINTGNSKPSGKVIDVLSGEEISYDGLRSAESPNPNLPYFVGFDLISDAGVSSDDMRYIQDLLINFCLYTKQINSAKISYVKDSFIHYANQNLTDSYSFKFGINDKDIYTIKILSDSIQKKEINITITDNSNKKVFGRTFHVFTL